MKSILSAILVISLLIGSLPAFALTGEEALGLVDSQVSGSEGLSSTYPILQVGSRDGDDSGAHVVMLQNRLQQLGYLSGAADGQYGSGTESAVLLFQEANGLTPTGIADDSTQSVLYSTDAKPAPVRATADSDVMHLQQALQTWGFLMGSADGVIGNATETAVAEFKNYIYNTNKHAYLAYATPAPAAAATPAPGEQPVAMDMPLVDNSVNGFDGEITDELLKFASGEYQFQVFQMVLQRSNEGPEVWRLQRRLHQLKYLFKPDGSFGGLTENALKYFQRKNGLPETGVADQATQELLFSTNALASEEYVFPYKIFIDRTEQRLYVYEWDGAGYNKQYAKAKCSTGQPGFETPAGTYQAAGKVNFDEWYYFADYNCYAKYAYRIVGGIMTHSVLYNSSKKGPTNSSVKALGRAVSHGCVRLAEDHAKWIWENCPEGTTFVVS